MITHLPGRIKAIDHIPQPIVLRMWYMYSLPAWWRSAALIRRSAAHATNDQEMRARHLAMASEYAEIAKEIEKSSLPEPRIELE